MNRYVFKVIVAVFLVLSLCPLIAGGAQGGSSSEVTTLELWTGWQPDHYMYEVYRLGLEEFNAIDPAIQVEHVTVSWGELQTKAAGGIAAGDVPNAVWGWDPLAFYGLSTNLNEFIDNDPSFNTKDLFDVAWEFVTVGDEIIALPCTLEPTVLLYNEPALKQAGLSGPPRTINEIDEYSRALSEVASDGTIKKLGYWPGLEAYNWGKYRFIIWPYLFGANWYDEQAGRFTLATEETIEAYEWMRAYVRIFGAENLKRYLVSNESVLKGIDGGTGPYYDGGVGFWQNAPWMLRMNALNDTVNVRVTATPRKETGRAFTSGCVWWMPKGVSDKDETWELFKYLAEESWQVRYSSPDADPQVPTNRRAFETLSKIDDPRMEWFEEVLRSDMINNAGVSPRVKEWQQVMTELNDMKDDLFFSDIPLVQLLRKVEDRVNN